MKDFDGDIKGELRRFLIYDLCINPLNIDEIKIDHMTDGQLRSINISFIPNIRGKDNND